MADVTTTKSVPDVSIIILNWNTPQITSAAIESIHRFTRDVAYEIILVENGSADTSAIDLPARFPAVAFILNKSNLGFCAGCNQGLRRATGRYLLLLNSDTVQTQNAIGMATAYMDQHIDIGALGIQHRNADDQASFQPSAFDFPNPLAEAASMLFLPPSQPQIIRQEQDVDWCCGSFLMIRRSCYEAVGHLDERLFAYDEDIDWCRRTSAGGWRIRYWPGASMIHLGSASSASIRDKTFVHFRNRLTYYRKHHGILMASLFYLAISFRLTVSTVAQAFKVCTGRASLADLKQRIIRQADFVVLRPGRRGI